MVTFHHPPLLSHNGYCLGVDVKPSTLLFLGPLATPPCGSRSCSSLTRSSSSVLPLTPHLLCTSLSLLHRQKASRFVHGRRYGVGLSVKVGLGLLGLYLWWGKLRLVTSWSCLGLVVVPKAIAMARLSVVASPLTILPPPPSRFCPLAPYYPLAGTLLLKPPSWLAPYCYSPAGTLLLLICWHPTARWLRSPLYPVCFYELFPYVSGVLVS